MEEEIMGMEKRLKNVKVCVTGASGYVASWLVMRLLQRGYHVVGTVRDPGDMKKVGHLWKLEGAEQRLQLVRAELMAEGSFDHAIHGCHAVFHTATPVVIPKSDPMAELVEPAVRGTLNVLRSCKKSASVKRVVVTSSSSAVRLSSDFDPNIPLDESSWTSQPLCCRFKLWYALAKTAAEKAAWEFAKENGLDVVSILPTFVIGPSLPYTLSATAVDVLGLLEGRSDRFETYGRMGYVHIDDVAQSHILALENPCAQGRYICSSNVVDVPELVSFLSSRYPNLNVPTQFPNLGERSSVPYSFDTSKLQKLGIRFKSIQQMFDDMIRSFQEQRYL